MLHSVMSRRCGGESEWVSLCLAVESVPRRTVHVLNVVLHHSQLTEPFPAHFALIRPLSGVDPLVVLERVFGPKRLPARCAAKRLLSGVRPHVILEVLLPAKRPAADIAVETSSAATHSTATASAPSPSSTSTAHRTLRRGMDRSFMPNQIVLGVEQQMAESAPILDGIAHVRSAHRPRHCLGR